VYILVSGCKLYHGTKKCPLVRVEMKKSCFMKISIESILLHPKDELEKKTMKAFQAVFLQK